MGPPASCLEYRIPASGKWATPSSIILIACERGEVASPFGQSATESRRNEAVDEPTLQEKERQEHDVRVVASGHVHQHRLLVAEGISHVWAPSSAFILNDRLQTRLGTKIVGFVDYRFDGTGVTIALARAPGMVDFDIADFPQAYSWQPRRGR